MISILKILRYIVYEPIKKRKPSLILLRITQLLHDRTAGRSNASFRHLGTMLKPIVPLPSSALMDKNAVTTSVSKLKRCGWDILPYRLSLSDVAELKKFAFSTPAYANEPSEQIHIDEMNIPNNIPRYMWRIDDLFHLPVIQRLITECPLHDIAQRYIGCRPIMTSLSLWLDSIYDKKFDAHIYHYDNDGPAFLKFFIYLSDVDIDSGAHTYIEGSQGIGKPAHLSRSKRYKRDELLKHYGDEKEIVFSAPAGTIIAEDTSGFHKGTTPKTNYRMLLHMQYAMLDIPHVDEFSPFFKKVSIDGINPAIKRICQKFIN